MPVVNSLSPISVSMRGVITMESSTIPGSIVHLKFSSSESPAPMNSRVLMPITLLPSKSLTCTSSAEAAPSFVTVAVIVIAFPTLLRSHARSSNPTTSEISRFGFVILMRMDSGSESKEPSDEVMYTCRSRSSSSSEGMSNVMENIVLLPGSRVSIVGGVQSHEEGMSSTFTDRASSITFPRLVTRNVNSGGDLFGS